jgi:hypothetical protein
MPTGVTGVTALLAQLTGLQGKYRGRSALVGYTQAYAIYVHENMEAKHPVGQAKFLETPLRENQADLRHTIDDALRLGVPLERALLMAGLQLQAFSQRLCPVDTGALRASAFTRLE